MIVASEKYAGVKRKDWFSNMHRCIVSAHTYTHLGGYWFSNRAGTSTHFSLPPRGCTSGGSSDLQPRVESRSRSSNNPEPRALSLTLRIWRFATQLTSLYPFCYPFHSLHYNLICIYTYRSICKKSISHSYTRCTCLLIENYSPVLLQFLYT